MVTMGKQKENRKIVGSLLKDVFKTVFIFLTPLNVLPIIRGL